MNITEALEIFYRDTTIEVYSCEYAPLEKVLKTIIEKSYAAGYADGKEEAELPDFPEEDYCCQRDIY